MENEKGYGLCGVGNNIRSTKAYDAVQKKKLKSLGRGQKMFISSISAYESGEARLIGYVKGLGGQFGLNIGPNGDTDYTYLLDRTAHETKIYVRRNR